MQDHVNINLDLSELDTKLEVKKDRGFRSHSGEKKDIVHITFRERRRVPKRHIKVLEQAVDFDVETTQITTDNNDVKVILRGAWYDD